jgi:hypothetical protein
MVGVAVVLVVVSTVFFVVALLNTFHPQVLLEVAPTITVLAAVVLAVQTPPLRALTLPVAQTELLDFFAVVQAVVAVVILLLVVLTQETAAMAHFMAEVVEAVVLCQLTQVAVKVAMAVLALKV